MDTRILVVEPWGNQDLDLGELFDPDGTDVAYLVITGEDIPIPDTDEIELFIYSSLGYDFTEDDLHNWDKELPWLPGLIGGCDEDSVSESPEDDARYTAAYTEYVIKWYSSKGYTAIKVPAMAMLSPL